MLLLILTFVCGLFFAAIIFQTIQVLIRTKLAVRRFKRQSNGIQIASGFQPIGGHVNTFISSNRTWRMFDEEHKRLGKTFAIFSSHRPAVSTIDLDLIKQIVLDDPTAHLDRVTTLDLPMDEIEKDSVFFAPAEQWRRLRAAIYPAFVVRRVKTPSVEAEVRVVINKFLDSIEARLDQAKAERNSDFVVLDAEDIFHRYTLDLVFSCFYKQENQIDHYAKTDFWQNLITEGSRLTSGPWVRFAVIFNTFKPIFQWVIANFHPQGLLAHKVNEFIIKQTKMNLEAKRQAQSAAKNKTENFDQDNMTLEDGSRFKRNLIDYVTDQFHEANKTSSDALARLFYNIAKHQDVQEKLREAILTNGLDSEYLTWCIKETLRIFPPAHIGCTRTTSKDVPLEDGKIIPEGTIVTTPAYTIHRLPEYWGPDADEFKPERWAKEKDFHPIQFIAFGAGRRNCLGLNFALHEIRLMVDVMMRRYKFEYLPSKSHGIMDFSTPFMLATFSDGPTNIKISRL